MWLYVYVCVGMEGRVGGRTCVLPWCEVVQIASACACGGYCPLHAPLYIIAAHNPSAHKCTFQEHGCAGERSWNLAAFKCFSVGWVRAVAVTHDATTVAPVAPVAVAPPGAPPGTTLIDLHSPSPLSFTTLPHHSPSPLSLTTLPHYAPHPLHHNGDWDILCARCSICVVHVFVAVAVVPVRMAW
jgi:hypothetical protein